MNGILFCALLGLIFKGLGEILVIGYTREIKSIYYVGKMCVGGWVCFPGRDGEYGMSKSTIEMRMGIECLGDSDGN